MQVRMSEPASIEDHTSPFGAESDTTTSFLPIHLGHPALVWNRTMRLHSSSKPVHIPLRPILLQSHRHLVPMAVPATRHPIPTVTLPTHIPSRIRLPRSRRPTQRTVRTVRTRTTQHRRQRATRRHPMHQHHQPEQQQRFHGNLIRSGNYISIPYFSNSYYLVFHGAGVGPRNSPLPDPRIIQPKRMNSFRPWSEGIEAAPSGRGRMAEG